MTERAARRDAAENRAAIIAAARALLPRDRDASIEAIAAEAGLSRRAVYGHFPSRDDLVREVVALGAARIAATMPTADELRGTDPSGQLAAIAVALWAEVSHVRSVAQLAIRGPLAAEVVEAFAPVRAIVREACARGQQDGSFRDDVDAETLARLVEGACFAVLDEATRAGTTTTVSTPSTANDGSTSCITTSCITPETVVVSALGMAGLDWRTAAATATATAKRSTNHPTKSGAA